MPELEVLLIPYSSLVRNRRNPPMAGSASNGPATGPPVFQVVQVLLHGVFKWLEHSLSLDGTYTVGMGGTPQEKYLWRLCKILGRADKVIVAQALTSDVA